MARDKFLRGLGLKSIGAEQSAPQNYGARPISDLELLTSRPSLLRTLLLIHEYLVVKRRRGFTYNGIKAYAASKGVYREFTDRTLDRNIRKLAELGFLDRIHPRDNKKKVIFIPTERFWRVIEEREGLIDDG